MVDYSRMTNDEFYEILAKLCDSDLSVPGAYEIYAEEYNNEILEVWAKRNPEDPKFYSITYDIVTEESSIDGDAAERGYLVNDNEIPMPVGIIGFDVTAWCEENKVETEVEEGDWFGTSCIRREDCPCERYMAEIILDLPHDVVEPSCEPWEVGSWYSLCPGSDDQWTAETEDGTPGTRSLAVHLDGWTEEQEMTIYQLVKAGDPNAKI